MRIGAVAGGNGMGIETAAQRIDELDAAGEGGGLEADQRLLGLGAGSGNAFALLPPQNATGNWIKIVQRVPVRIALDPRELAQHPLRIGLSVTADVDTSVTSGPLVAGSAAPAGGIEQSVDGGPQIEATIRRIIAENQGSAR